MPTVTNGQLCPDTGSSPFPWAGSQKGLCPTSVTEITLPSGKSITRPRNQGPEVTVGGQAVRWEDGNFKPLYLRLLQPQQLCPGTQSP